MLCGPVERMEPVCVLPLSPEPCPRWGSPSQRASAPSCVIASPLPPSRSPLPEAVLPWMTTLPWRSEIFKEETNTCQALGFLEPIAIVCPWE